MLPLLLAEPLDSKRSTGPELNPAGPAGATHTRAEALTTPPGSPINVSELVS